MPESGKKHQENAEKEDTQEKSSGGPALKIDNARNDMYLAGLVVALAGLLACFAIGDDDFWWHLGNGKFICQQSSIPTSESFFYGFEDETLVNSNWLWDVKLYVLYSAFGAKGLTVLKVLAVMGLALVLLQLRAPGPTLWWSSVVVALVLGPMSWHFLMRPEITSLLLLALVLWILHHHHTQRGSRWIYALPAVLLVWANSDWLFVLGVAVLVLTVVGQWVHLLNQGDRAAQPDRRWTMRLTLVLLGSVVACFVNPFLHNGVTFAVSHLADSISNPQAHMHTGEVVIRLSDTGAWTLTHGVFVGVTAMAAASFAFNAARFRLERLLILVAFGLWGLTQAYIGVATMVVGAVLSLNMSEWWLKRFGTQQAEKGLWAWYGQVGRALTLVGLVLVAVTCVNGSLAVGTLSDPWQRLSWGVRPNHYGTGAVRFLNESNMPGRGFASTWRQAAVLVAEGRQTLFDERSDRLKPEPGDLAVALRGALIDNRRAELRVDPKTGKPLAEPWPGWGAAFDRHRVTHVLVPLAPPQPRYVPDLMGVMHRSRHWQMVYMDSMCAVFARREPADAELAAAMHVYIDKHAIDLDRQEFVKDERDEAILTETRAPTFLEKIWQTRPERPTGAVSLGGQYLMLGYPQLAVRQVRQALIESPYSARGYWLLGEAYEALLTRERKAMVPASPLGQVQPLLTLGQALTLPLPSVVGSHAVQDAGRVALQLEMMGRREATRLDPLRVRQIAMARVQAAACGPRQPDFRAKVHWNCFQFFQRHRMLDLTLRHAEAYLQAMREVPGAGDRPDPTVLVEMLEVPKTPPPKPGEKPRPSDADKKTAKRRNVEVPLSRIIKELRREVLKAQARAQKGIQQRVPVEIVARDLVARGFPGEAIRMLREGYDAGRRSPMLVGLLVDQYVKTGEVFKAEELLNPTRLGPQEQLALAEQLVTVWTLLGNYKMARDLQGRKTLQMYQEAAQYQQLALAKLLQGDTVACVSLAGGRLAQTIDRLAQWQYWRGLVDLESGNVTAAAQSFVEAIKAGPNSAYAEVARYYLRQLASSGTPTPTTQPAATQSAGTQATATQTAPASAPSE